MSNLLEWVRENYGWQTKRAGWATLAFGLLILVAVVGVLTNA